MAKRLLDEYADNLLDLADVLILLPNRRACKTLAEAFVRLSGLVPTLLPRMTPIGDRDEDELVLQGADAGEEFVSIKPAINPTERLLLFIRLIMARPEQYGLDALSVGQACFLAQELARLADTVYSEELDFANLKNLVPEEYAAHWQETLKFLEIITNFWPQILQERGVCDNGQRRVELLKKQSAIWRANPPKQRVILAGSTATYPSMKLLVDVVSQMPRGEVILSGLDKLLDEDSWASVDETHPQFELKEVLDYLQVSRNEVEDICLPKQPEREKLISEIMRPATMTDKWREIADKKIQKSALSGLRLIECKDIREEALCIALIMREVLETPEKIAALVTPDRNLARRVAAELERWDIKIDDSAGRPLAVTPIGSFLRLVAQVAQQEFGRVDVLALMKHPLCGMGRAYQDVRKAARNIERNFWRVGKEIENDDFLIETEKIFSEWRTVLQRERVSLKELIRQHLKTAEALAATVQSDGATNLWRGEAGEVAAVFFADWMENADDLGEIEPKEYVGLFEAMTTGITVRPKYGTHPRLKILGPIEARLGCFDTVIVGELNEGVWPQAAASDPWMSRPMKRDFGFPQPEKAIGVLGLDLCHQLGATEVFLTRAERVQGTPMVKSRWWMRLETVLEALVGNCSQIVSRKHQALSCFLDEPEKLFRISSPAPRPPVAARPRELSASGIELLMRDPYSVFAKYILRLKPLEDIEPDLTMADYGTIIHGILEEFNDLYSASLPDDASEKLLELGRKRFMENRLAMERRAFWWPNFEKTVSWLAQVEKNYRGIVKAVHNEIKGEFNLSAPTGIFKITAKADRVDETLDGKVNIIDYKTGKARTSREMEKGFAPQLPIEGLIAQKGGFKGMKAAEPNSLIYWQLGKKATEFNGDMKKLLADMEQRLQRLVAEFDFETTAYICHPNPKQIPEYSDYEHLARVKEWSVQSDDE